MYRKVYTIFPKVIQTLFWLPDYLFFRFFLHLSVEGKENVSVAADMRQGTGILCIMNHITGFDPVAMQVGIPPLSSLLPIFYVAHEDSKYRSSSDFGLMRFVYGGILFRLMGAYPIKSGLRDYETSTMFHVDAINKGKSVCIFPTGGWLTNGDPKPVRGGVGFMAEKTNAPILPIHISISNRAIMNLRSVLSRKHHMTIRYGHPFFGREYLDAQKGIPERYQDASLAMYARILQLEPKV